MVGIIVLPMLDVSVPVVLPGRISTPGSLQALAVALVFAGLAESYDIVFGFAGLLSFGHAVFFGIGIYGTNLLMGAGQPFVVAALLAVPVATTAAVLVGAIAPRLAGIALLMTKACRCRPGVPEVFRKVINTSHLYWLALAYLILACVVARIVSSGPGCSCCVATRPRWAPKRLRYRLFWSPDESHAMLAASCTTCPTIPPWAALALTFR